MWFSPVKEINSLLAALLEAPSKTSKSPTGRPPKVSEAEILAFNPADWYHRITNQQWNGPLERFSLSDESIDWLKRWEDEPDHPYANWIAYRLGELAIDEFLPADYFAWMKELLSPDRHCAEPIIRLSNTGSPLQLSFAMIYQYVRGVLEIVLEGDRDFESYERAHSHTAKMLRKAQSALHIYGNCCLGEEKFRDIDATVAQVLDERLRLLTIADHSIGVLLELERWVAESYNPNNQSMLQNYLLARSLPSFISLCEHSGLKAWWSEAQVLLQEGMDSYCRITGERPPDVSLTDTYMDSDHLRYLGTFRFGEGAHMLSYMSNWRYPKDEFSKVLFEFLKNDPHYKGQLIE